MVVPEKEDGGDLGSSNNQEQQHHQQECGSSVVSSFWWQALKRRQQAEEEESLKSAKKKRLELIKHQMEQDLIIFSLDDHHDVEDDKNVGQRRGNKRTTKKKSTNGELPCRRRMQGVVLYKDPVTMEMKKLDPTMSLWYNYYCKGLEHGMELIPSFHDKFRRTRFRLPYTCYLELLEMCEEEAASNDGYMKRWKVGAKAASKKAATPLSLLLLCALRYLGRGWTFDDLEESTAISQEVVWNFLREFIAYGAEKLFKKWVYSPRDLEEAYSVTAEYTDAGFPGCVGSMDASHIEHSRIAYDHRQAHLSHKLPFTSRTYIIVTNHRRRILGTTKGHPARWNDKSLVKFDEIAMDLHEGKGPMKDLEFELYDYEEEEDGTKTVKKVKYKGAWLLVDNGYMNWGVTIPPMKCTDTKMQWRFSKWLESMRKDVECTFGIMKGRWRILKSGIRLHGTDSADKTWMTCCALHNWLLVIDGLDEKWGSEWQGGMGDNEEDDLPQSVRTLLSRHHIPANYDGSGMGHGNDRHIGAPAEGGQDNDEEEDFVGSVEEVNGAIVVRKLSMKQFRERLIRHFDIAFRKKEIHWPKAKLMNAEEPTIY